MSLQINNLHITTATAKPKTPPGREFTISPSLYGRTRWNLDNLSRMNISGSGQWTITPTTDFTANVKMWGASGTMYTSGNAGAGGYSSGTASFKGGVPYILVVGEGGKRVVGSGYHGYGNGGYTFYSSGNAVQGGGMSGIFSESYTQNGAIIIAGGGGSGIHGSYTNGAGGGSSGQNANNGGNTGGTQSAGGTGTYTGSALRGSVCPVSTSYNSAGGGGYYGGGAGSGVSSASGGSGYIRTSVVTNGVTTTGVGSTPANASDIDRGSSGGRDSSSSPIGNDGRVIIS